MCCARTKIDTQLCRVPRVARSVKWQFVISVNRGHFSRGQGGMLCRSSIWATLSAECAQWITPTSVNSCSMLSAWRCYHCLAFCIQVFCFVFIFAFAPEINMLLMCPENVYGNALIYHQQLVFIIESVNGMLVVCFKPRTTECKFLRSSHYIILTYKLFLLIPWKLFKFYDLSRERLKNKNLHIPTLKWFHGTAG